MKGIKSSIRSRENDGYGSKESKLVSLILKNEAISITLIRISLLKGIWTLFDERGMSLRSFCLINHKMTNIVCT